MINFMEDFFNDQKNLPPIFKNFAGFFIQKIIKSEFEIRHKFSEAFSQQKQFIFVLNCFFILFYIFFTLFLIKQNLLEENLHYNEKTPNIILIYFI